ncbi:MAG: hypothetical protein ACREHG_10750, partial [Candidatus Saccharimonadales bacterium]
MDKDATPAAVVNNKKSHRGFLKRPSLKASMLGILVILLMVAIVWKIYDSYVNRPVVIGGTRITSQEINAYAAEIKRFTATHKENFGGTPTQVAKNDLVLNAALKDQAQKHHVTLTQADIDAALKNKYEAYGSKQAYQAALKSLSIVNIMKIRDQNTAYESVLQNTLIANKQLFMVGIYYNAPYFTRSQDQATLRAQATKVMKNKFLPLFQKHLSKEAIGKQTTINELDPLSPGGNSSLFFTGMPTTDMYIPSFSDAQPTFNDSGNDNIPDEKSTNQAAESLTKVGQYTPVETFKAGFIGILRLEGKTQGSY